MSKQTTAGTLLGDTDESKTNTDDFVDKEYIRQCQDVYRDIVLGYPLNLGKSVSKKERENKNNIKDANLVYGELNFETLAIALEKIKNVYGKPLVGSSGIDGIMQSRGGTFYDLGSGTGKAVVAAAVMYNFDLCCGIEILEGLYSVSFDVMATYNTKGKAHPYMAGREHDTHVQMVMGDFLDLKVKDWTEADVVYMNSTCYDDRLIGKVTDLALGMKKGSFMISITKRLPIDDFLVLEFTMCPMSWGDATLYIMQKLTEPRESKNFDNDEDD